MNLVSGTLRSGQRGTVLVISLVMLMVMTLIGLTAMQTTILEEKMSGNMRDQNVAFQAAEAGLREVLDWIDDKSRDPAGFPVAKPDGSSKIWSECKIDNGCTDKTAPSIDWIASKGESYGSWQSLTADQIKAMSDSVYATPVTLVEERYSPPPEYEEHARKKGVVYYTVMALGYGATSQARALLQTTVPVPRL